MKTFPLFTNSAKEWNFDKIIPHFISLVNNLRPTNLLWARLMRKWDITGRASRMEIRHGAKNPAGQPVPNPPVNELWKGRPPTLSEFVRNELKMTNMWLK